MRFVKVNCASTPQTLKNPERNCVACTKIRIDTCNEAKKNNKKLNHALDSEYLFKYTNGKLKRRFSVMNIIKIIKNEASAWYNALNKKNTSAACAVVCAFGMALLFNVNFSFAYSAFFNGTELGFVPGRSYVQSCIDSINAEFSEYVSGEDIISGSVVYTPAIIRKNAFTDKAALAENIKSTSDVMIKAFAVEVDGKAFAALESNAEAESVLNTIMSVYKTDASTEISFDENVCVLNEYVPASILMSAPDALERLGGYTTVYNTVTTAEKTTIALFCEENGLDQQYLKDLNPDLSDNIAAKTEIIIPVYKPVITVVSTDTVSYETPVPFAEQVTEDNSMYQGSEKILRAGVNGTDSVTEKIVRTNGKVAVRTVLSTVRTCEPTSQLRAVGTMERPDYMGTGSFIRPYYGTISSRFGSRRSGNHTGVDFCGNRGDAIIAADNGTVIFSGWSGGYGKVIKIDHHNGYITYYAHCNSLDVNEGDVVKKGQKIATVGSTGNSTGPHVHFEIRYNDEVLNPMNYVN